MKTKFACASIAALGVILAPMASAQTPPAKPIPATAPSKASAAAVAYKAPRTSYGTPSFEGVWSANFFLPLEATPQQPNLVTDEAGSKQALKAFVAQISAIPALNLDPEIGPGLESSQGLAIVRGERRTRAVVSPASGMLPYTPVARGQSMSGFFSLGPMDNPEQRPTMERCLSGFAIPPIASTNANPLRIVQTPAYVVLHAEYNSDLRIIPFASEHKAPMFTTWLGDSIARWEGDTLVIETIRTAKQDRVRLFPPLVVPDTSKITERITRIAENELLYQYTIEDPSVYTGPWLAEYSLYPAKAPTFEFACHEGNYSLPNILRAQRIKEENTAKAAVKPKTP